MASIPERLAVVESETRHTRQLMEQHIAQTTKSFDHSDKKREEMSGKVDEILTAMNKGKGGLVVFGAGLTLIGGATGGAIAKAIGAIFK